jgi:hypothetical protein
MKNAIKLLTLACLFLYSNLSICQFILSGQIRPRMEYRHGYKSLPDSAVSAATFVDQRSRLNFDFRNENYQVKLVLQDVRVWGATPQLNSSDAYSSVHEAWGEAFIRNGWSLKFGRQEIIYDDHRLFGNVDWAQQARSHDAIAIKFRKNGLALNIVGAYNQDNASLAGTSATLGTYKAFQSVWINKVFNENLKISLLFLNLGKQAIDQSNGSYWDNYTQTFGTHTRYRTEKISVIFNGYYQVGKTNETTANDVSAYNVGLNLNYKLSKNYDLSLGYELLSGNSQMDTTPDYVADQHAFNPYFGTNHKFNGYMDYFYVGNWSGSVGLQDIALKLKYRKKKAFLGLDAHIFMAAAKVFDSFKFDSEVSHDIALGGDGSSVNRKIMSSYLGLELDLSFGFPISNGVMLKSGYGHMFGSETLACLNGITYASGVNAGKGRTDQISNWGFIMLVIKPTFLEVDKNLR